MFTLLGTIFSFITSDISSKLGILHEYRKGEDEITSHFLTVQGLIQYEVEQDLTIRKGKPPSASRTLLRLHRALQFILRFLDDLQKVEPSTKLGSVAGKAYHETLAKHHIWIVRKTVGVAVMTLSSRDHFLEKMGEETIEGTLELLSDCVTHAQPLYDMVQDLYTQHDLLNLP